MNSRNVRQVCLLAALASLLTFGPRLAAQSQQEEKTQAQGEVEGTQTEVQSPNAGASTVESAQSAQNPLSSISMVLLQNTTDFHIGPNGRVQNTLPNPSESNHNDST